VECAFRLAANQPDIKLGSAAGALLLNEGFGDYKGDPHELVLLHTLSMLNYSFMGQWDEALVEARGANSLMAHLEASGRVHVEDPLSRYYSAKLFERMEQWDDAYIDMARARKAFRDLAPITKVPEPSFLAGDLMRLARKAGRQDELRLLKMEYPSQAAELKAGEGEVWILVFDGSVASSPEKAKKKKAQRGGPDLTVTAGLRGGSQAPLELVYDSALMTMDAQKAKSLGEGVRSFTRFSFRLSLMVGLAVLTQGKGVDARALEFIFKDPSEAKRWDNVPARVYACRLVAPAGKQALWLKGRDPNGEKWQEEVVLRVPQGKAGLAQLKLRPNLPLQVGRKRSLYLSPSLRP
jgi:hypothetical protein